MTTFGGAGDGRIAQFRTGLVLGICISAHGQICVGASTRSLAVVASLYRYWHATGYLLGNPAASLSPNARSCSEFAPLRFVRRELLEACDQWVKPADTGATHAAVIATRSDRDDHEKLRSLRRVVVWMLYRFSTCASTSLSGIPQSSHIGSRRRRRVDAAGDRHGSTERAIQPPRLWDDTLRRYRLAREFPSQPDALEQRPLIPGEKDGTLGTHGLSGLIKAVPNAAADARASSDPARAAMLRAASPHRLRHAYARTLVVDHNVSLPSAQALLGHASVQTTAAYAKTDQSKLREFVDVGFEHSWIE